MGKELGERPLGAGEKLSPETTLLAPAGQWIPKGKHGTLMRKLPQNIQSLIGEIGEKQVLLRQSLLTLDTDWQVFRDLGEAGYDVLLLHPRGDS